MRHATWNAIEANPFAMRLYRSYRRLPEEVRAPTRWIVTPRWQAACTMIRQTARNEVLSGPFQGMRLHLSPLSERQILAYLLGTYELELFPLIEDVIRQPYSAIVNIGVADGYYAIGLARRMPSIRVIGFEGLPEHHAPFWRTARANGVSDRMTLKGFCTANELRDALAKAGSRPFVLCDIEGGEKELLDNAGISGLDRADILVETHDDLVQGCSERLLRRFGESHDITSIYARPRTMRDFPAGALPALAKWMPGTAVELMNERRTGCQEWLFLTPRRAGAVERQ